MSTETNDRSHLFVVRVWAERLGDSHTEFRGQVQHVLSGEIRHFRDWQTLNGFLAQQVETEKRENS